MLSRTNITQFVDTDLRLEKKYILVDTQLLSIFLSYSSES